MSVEKNHSLFDLHSNVRKPSGRLHDSGQACVDRLIVGDRLNLDSFGNLSGLLGEERLTGFQGRFSLGKSGTDDHPGKQHAEQKPQVNTMEAGNLWSPRVSREVHGADLCSGSAAQAKALSHSSKNDQMLATLVFTGDSHPLRFLPRIETILIEDAPRTDKTTDNQPYN
ncbi:MAG: hypothetical protein PHC98_01270 [Syntrophotalea acetylenica]|nr:hypothetical protein [Syntrophotalea acetylenica]MDD4456193.1 hypothetical protein [Syntrophotalea acetylenica]